MSINDGLALIRRHDFEGALPLLAAEVRKRPDDAYAAYYLAYAFVGAQDPQPAVTLLAKIIEVHPDFTDARSLLGLARAPVFRLCRGTHRVRDGPRPRTEERRRAAGPGDDRLLEAGNGGRRRLSRSRLARRPRGSRAPGLPGPPG